MLGAVLWHHSRDGDVQALPCPETGEISWCRFKPTTSARARHNRLSGRFASPQGLQHNRGPHRGLGNCRAPLEHAAPCICPPYPPLPRPMQAFILLVAAAWLLFCTYMFHGVLEVQLNISDNAGAQEVPPTERQCSGLFASWCERHVAQYRAEAVRQGMMHAWQGYKSYAWGADEIHPKSKTAKTDIMVRSVAAPGGLFANRQAGVGPCVCVIHAFTLEVAAGRCRHCGHGRQHGRCAIYA